MTGFFDKLKRGADKAAFEADKLMRAQKLNSEIGTLKNEIRQHNQTLGEKALELHLAGDLRQPELAEVCQQIQILKEQIAEKEQEITTIRQEDFPEQPVPSVYGRVCFNCGTQLSDEARFCPDCGTPIQSTS